MVYHSFCIVVLIINYIENICFCFYKFLLKIFKNNLLPDIEAGSDDHGSVKNSIPTKHILYKRFF